jgi:hypothetical protein
LDINNYITVAPSEFDTWRHVAGVLENGRLNIYENGVKLSSSTFTITVCNQGRSNLIGAQITNPPLNYYDYFQGAMDEVRISNVARYTSNFTPPQLPFTPDANTLMLYHFDGDANDSSENNLHGQVIGDVSFTNVDRD